MSCSEIEELLSAYLDHELSSEEIIFLEKHLEHCDFCRQTLIDMQRTRDLLQSLPNVPIPDDFNDQLKELLIDAKKQLDDGTKDRCKYHWLQRIFKYSPLVSAALIFVFCLTAYSFMNFKQNGSDSVLLPALKNGEVGVQQAESKEFKSKEMVLDKANYGNNNVDEKNEIEGINKKDQGEEDLNTIEDENANKIMSSQSDQSGQGNQVNQLEQSKQPNQAQKKLFLVIVMLIVGFLLIALNIFKFIKNKKGLL